MEQSARKADIETMEIVLNELSLVPLAKNKYEAHEYIKEFARAAAEGRKRLIKKIRSCYSRDKLLFTSDYSLKDWLFDKNFINENRTCRDFLFDMIEPPFIKDEDEAEQEEYILSDYYFEDRLNNIEKQKCPGLASACIYGTLSISFQNGNAWKKNTLVITSEKRDKTERKNVLNIFSVECFSGQLILETIAKKTCSEPIKTAIPPNSKELHLSPHHGKKELSQFWRKLRNCPYVISAVSTDWGGREFVRKIDENGTIELVLTKSEREYAMKVQTTGRNQYETKKIAEILEREYY
jgi:hypothetical protein